MEYTLRLCAMTIFVVCCAGTLRAQFLGQQSLSESSYVIDQSGNLWAWGSNDFAQLGTGDRVDRDTPYRVPLPEGASRWTLVAGGQSFTLALADSDKLYAWGLNDKGQLGFGMAGGVYGSPMRIQNPSTTSKWKWISAGAKHCEALTTDGRLFAWGDNSQGQLGPGNTKYLVTPEPVEFPAGVTSWAAVAAGPGYTMMIAQNGLLYGCGIDSLGTFMPWEGPQLVGTDTFRAYSPLSCLGASGHFESRIDQSYFAQDSDIFYVSPDGGSIESIAEVADGNNHALFLSMFGSIGTLGDGRYGQLGNGSTDTNLHETLIHDPPGVTQFVAVAAGLRHSLAIANDGWLYAWGDDSLGELGIKKADSNAGLKELFPVRVKQVCPPVSMAATLVAPGSFFGSYNIGLHLKNRSDTSSLANPTAYLVLGSPLTHGDSSLSKSFPTVPPNDSISVTWNETIDSFLNVLVPTYFVYVQANGSAPLLVPDTVNTSIVPGPWTIHAVLDDSLTGLPVSGALISITGDTTDSLGGFSFVYGIGNGSVRITKENYRTPPGLFSVTNPFDTLRFWIGPSPVQGMFEYPQQALTGDSIQRIYFPDSIVGYAISRNFIFRSNDDGNTWTAIYWSDTDLSDLKFLDPAHGWIVGNEGMILHTSDSGKSWNPIAIATKNNLRSIAMSDFDSAWAVGDNGTVVKLSDTFATLQKPIDTLDLTCVHFFDTSSGVAGATATRSPFNKTYQYVNYFSYGGENWGGGKDSDYLPKTAPDCRTVYDPNPSPSGAYFGTANGDIYWGGQDLFQSIHAINSLYFLNGQVGFAMGDSGASYVTYDSGAVWANLREIPATATSVNFFGLSGHAAIANGVMNYRGAANAIAGIVEGRITYGNPPIPIMAAKVVRIYTDSLANRPYVLDSTYTNDQGNFLFADLDTFFRYDYVLDFVDSGMQKTVTFNKIRPHRQQVVSIDYNDYTPPAPPPPDTNLAVNPVPTDALSLDVIATGASAQIVYDVPNGGMAHLVMQDILGRVIRHIADGFVPLGTQTLELNVNDVPNGVYYITLTASTGSITKKFELER